ncbi:MAG: 5'-methylthioadenosine/adenosylhomocysteine nucleosidase [Clostridia bacterium]|nr:5'-methylthioadenosine/adenosylhomocysteine nucleosidase [Clostridia bacterium]
MRKYDVGIIGAMEPEIELLVASLTSHKVDTVGTLTFHRGKIGKKKVVVVRSGVGKVFAALTAEAMILKYAPRLIINTGVGGGLAAGLSVGDVLVADKLVQHDMDTSPLGDPKGLISGINKIFFETDNRAAVMVCNIAEKLSLKCRRGTVASGDVFVSTSTLKESIRADFGADACEMEGAAIAHVAYVNSTPCCVIRAISDSADEESTVSYQEFLPVAAKNSASIVLELCRAY